MRRNTNDDDTRRSGGLRAGSIVLVIVLALVAGMGGGLASRFLPVHFAGEKDTVTFQTAPEKADTSATTIETAVAAKTIQAANPSAIEKVAASATASVVEVATDYKITNPLFGSLVMSGAGSGVILSEEGYVVTNNHVVEGAETIQVLLPGGEEVEGKLVARDEQTDLAVLKITADGLSPAAIADSDAVVVGQPVAVIGNPLGTLGESVTEGIISAKDREITIEDETMVLLQTSAAINPGNSGGGLFNMEGQLIGVVNAKSAGVEIEGLGFAIPSNTVKEVVAQLIENGYVTGRPSLGISIVEANNQAILEYYHLTDPGVYVYHSVYDNGLKQWDRIKKADGQEIETAADLKALVQSHKVGDTLEIVVMRGTQEKTLQIKLRERVLAEDGEAA